MATLNNLDFDCVLFPLMGEIGILGDSCTTLLYAINSSVTVTGNTMLTGWYGRAIIAYKSAITLSGNNNNTITLCNLNNTAIAAYRSDITLSGNVQFFNNSGTRGGAIALYASTLSIAKYTSVVFRNGRAREVGGAIFVMNTPVHIECFFRLLDFNVDDTTTEAYSLQFEANGAENGGDHIYGVNLKYACWNNDKRIQVDYPSIFFDFVSNSNLLSPVSSDPTRICLCNDDNDQPQCADSISDIYSDHKLSPGETLTLSVAIVGGDFGTTTGTVYANFLQLSDPYNRAQISLKGKYQQAQLITSNKQCTPLCYTIYSNSIHESAVLYLKPTTELQDAARFAFDNKDELIRELNVYHDQKGLIISPQLLSTPIFLNITILPCPPGFSVMGDPPSCNCLIHSETTKYSINCSDIGTISWTGPLWFGIRSPENENETDSELQVNFQCPLDYCKADQKIVTFRINDSQSDIQCASNRAGRLCGGCKEGYSLAIGSSHCIHCPNNNNLALLIFFAAAGFLLVFFISAFNLTVTQGMINGLIFYANIIWAYQDQLFPQQTNVNANVSTLMAVIKTFIAWFNLDFGIQTCFINGLNALGKTWLQYVFPFYTAGLFFIGLRYSSKLSNFFGSRSVPTLATLLFLSHTKLLRTIITSLELSRLTNYPSKSSLYIWSSDGRLDYGQFPHITLLLMAIGCLLILWLPYAMLLLLMQWLRRIPNFTVSKWITRYKPVIDAYFAPLKDKHHYWFGVLLLSRGILLLVSSLTANINPAVSLFLLHSVTILLLCYINYEQVYKRKSVLILESAFLINLIILTGGAMYYHNDTESSEKIVLISISICIAFIKFCIIVIWSIVQIFPRCQLPNKAPYRNIEESIEPPQNRETTQISGQFRDSILEESQLLPTY